MDQEPNAFLCLTFSYVFSIYLLVFFLNLFAFHFLRLLAFPKYSDVVIIIVVIIMKRKPQHLSFSELGIQIQIFKELIAAYLWFELSLMVNQLIFEKSVSISLLKSYF